MHTPSSRAQLIQYKTTGKVVWDVMVAANGALAGLVAITAPCATVRCLPPGARTSIGSRRPGRHGLLRIPTTPTTSWGVRVRQDGEQAQGGVTLGRSAGGRVAAAMERVLYGPPLLPMIDAP